MTPELKLRVSARGFFHQSQLFAPLFAITFCPSLLVHLPRHIQSTAQSPAHSFHRSCQGHSPLQILRAISPLPRAAPLAALFQDAATRWTRALPNRAQSPPVFSVRHNTFAIAPHPAHPDSR